ncbi:hypothetical protein MNV49_001171 [Pseudohyphozyma bogoriensis]|nr:hypothetical protein MNV49_001171 [Pseudohyphozyma bogoriensis]
MVNESKIQYKPLHPTFAAEASGLDFSSISQKDVDEIKAGLAKTGLDDTAHVRMSEMFGDLDDVKPYITGLGQINRLAYDELFDVSNINPDGTLTMPGSKRDILARCNVNFHVDSAFNPRRAGISLLLAHELPPKGTGGHTQFADTRTAYADLDDATKARIKDYVVNNSQFQCRRVASPGNPILDAPEYDPKNNRFGLHKLVQTHEASGRENLYIAAHAHSIVGLSDEEGEAEIKLLMDHCSKDVYKYTMEWHNPGDLLVWDNTCLMHRSVPGTYEGKYRRDMRRTTVHDMSSQAWGLNEVGATWRSGLP